MVTVWTTEDSEEALTRSGAFLRAEPVLNNLLLTLLTTRRTPATTIGVDDERGTVAVLRLGSERDQIAVSEADPAIVSHLVPTLAALTASARVTGPASIVTPLVGAWTEYAGIGASPDRGQRLYECTEPPDLAPPPPGRVRAATSADIDTLIAFRIAFDRDIDEPSTLEQISGWVTSSLEEGRAALFETDEGVTSMCVHTKPIEGVVRVQGVYTPPEHRGRGHASACVGAVTGDQRAKGQRVMLYTDLANPTSNRVYRRLGYRAVSEQLTYRLLPG